MRRFLRIILWLAVPLAAAVTVWGATRYRLDAQRLTPMTERCLAPCDADPLFVRVYDLRPLLYEMSDYEDELDWRPAEPETTLDKLTPAHWARLDGPAHKSRSDAITAILESSLKKNSRRNPSGQSNRPAEVRMLQGHLIVVQTKANQIRIQRLLIRLRFYQWLVRNTPGFYIVWIVLTAGLRMRSGFSRNSGIMRRLARGAVWLAIPLIAALALWGGTRYAMEARRSMGRSSFDLPSDRVVTRMYCTDDFFRELPRYSDSEQWTVPEPESTIDKLWPIRWNPYGSTLKERESSIVRIIGTSVDPAGWNVEDRNLGWRAPFKHTEGRLYVSQSLADQLRVRRLLQRMRFYQWVTRHVPGFYVLWIALALAVRLHNRLFGLAAARRRRGLCAGCGYDLRATPARCPECGAIRLGKVAAGHS